MTLDDAVRNATRQLQIDNNITGLFLNSRPPLTQTSYARRRYASTYTELQCTTGTSCVSRYVS